LVIYILPKNNGKLAGRNKIELVKSNRCAIYKE
jgi:hypothetical protein